MYLIAVYMWLIARSSDTDVECHMAEGSPGSGRIIPQRLCTDQYWCNNTPCQSQHPADCRCVLGGRKTRQVSIQGLFHSINKIQIDYRLLSSC